MTTCQFCNLPAENGTYFVYDLEVCEFCVQLAEMSYEGEGEYLENMAFDIAYDR